MAQKTISLKQLIDYAERLPDLMLQEDWKWNPVQSLIYFARKHRDDCKIWGDYAIGRDCEILSKVKQSLEADGMTIQPAIDLFFSVWKTGRNQEWLKGMGWNVPSFKSSLTGIKQKLLERRERGKVSWHTCGNVFSCEYHKVFEDYNRDRERIPDRLPFCQGLDPNEGGKPECRDGTPAPECPRKKDTEDEDFPF